MKVILSRKGFDDVNGGCPSPILPDGTMISMPIPDKSGNYSYDELAFPGGKTYAEVWKELASDVNHIARCHLDPDIRISTRKVPDNWVPAFGQRMQAQTHLENQHVNVGDLFIFFGYFCKTDYSNSTVSFEKGAPLIHAIYGYLQIGKIVKGLDVRQYPWHPHSDDSHIYEKGKMTNNTIYVASDQLIIDGKTTDLPGAGVLPYAEKRVLTIPGASNRTRWKLVEPFGVVPLSYHYSPDRIKNGYFQSCSRGQEFVFDEDDRVTAWAKSIILDDT